MAVRSNIGSVSRRALLGATTAAAGGAVLGAGGVAQAESQLPKAPARLRRGSTVRPPKLRAGDKIRVVSPGGTPNEESMAIGIELLESWGLEVELAPHVYDTYNGYLAGPDEARLGDLNAALADPDVRGVFASRGGYGCQRIADGIDFDAVRADPKVLVGFSDLTALQAVLWESASLATVHGPMVNWDAERTREESAEALRKAVMTTDDVVLHRDPDVSTAPVRVSGRASGVVVGGNLSLVSAAVGAADELDTDDAILFLEEVGEAHYRLDRMLTQLRRSKLLRNVAGIALGQVTGTPSSPGVWGAAEVFADRLGDLGVPVLGGLKIGHGDGQLTLPLGSHAELDADAGTLRVTAAVFDS